MTSSFVHEVILLVLGPINQVATPCSSISNPKKGLRIRTTPLKRRGDQRGISQEIWRLKEAVCVCVCEREREREREKETIAGWLEWRR